MSFATSPLAVRPTAVGEVAVAYIIDDVASLQYYFYDVTIDPDGTVLQPGGNNYDFDNETVSLTVGGYIYQRFDYDEPVALSITSSYEQNLKFNYDDPANLTLEPVSLDEQSLTSFSFGLPLPMLGFSPMGMEWSIGPNPIDIAEGGIGGYSLDNYIQKVYDYAELRSTGYDNVLRTFGYTDEHVDLELLASSNARTYTFLINVTIDDPAALRWYVDADSMFIPSPGVPVIPQIWIG